MYGPIPRSGRMAFFVFCIILPYCSFNNKKFQRSTYYSLFLNILYIRWLSRTATSDPACLSLTLLRPTTPKTTTTDWATSPLFREFNFLSIRCGQVHTFKKKFVLFPEIRTVLCRLFWSQQPQKRLLPEQPCLSLESSTSSIKCGQVRAFKQFVQPKSSYYFRRSGLFFFDSSEANNPKNDNYCLNDLPSLQRVQFPLFQTVHSTKKFVLFPEIRALLLRLFWGQQPQKWQLLTEQPRLSSESSISSLSNTAKSELSNSSFNQKVHIISGDPGCSSLTLMRPTTPKITTTTWTTLPLFREFNFLSIKRGQVRAFKQFVRPKVRIISGDPGCSSSTLLRPTTPKRQLLPKRPCLSSESSISSLSNSLFNQKVRIISGDPGSSSSTLLRPTTPKMTTTDWTTSPLFREFNFLSIKRGQVRAFKQFVQLKSSYYFRRSELFFVDSSKANNPKSDYYLHNLASL